MTIKIGITSPESLPTFKIAFGTDVSIIKTVAEIKNYDLIIIPDGPDLNPKYYNDTNNWSFPNEDRDSFEVPLIKEAIKLKKHVLGIGRGMLAYYVFLTGGNILQELYLGESGSVPSHSFSHKLELASANVNYLANKYFNGITVTSRHHQGLNSRYMSNNKVTAVYNSIVEIIEGDLFKGFQFRVELQKPVLNDNYNKLFADIIKWVETPVEKKETSVNGDEITYEGLLELLRSFKDA